HTAQTKVSTPWPLPCPLPHMSRRRSHDAVPRAEDATGPPRKKAKGAQSEPLTKALGAWVLESVQSARRSLGNGGKLGASEAASRLAAVVEAVPSLWPELQEDLLRALWIAADPSLRARLAEGAAGSLLGAGSQQQAPEGLSGLFRLLGEAQADEGRYCAAFRTLRRAAAAARQVRDIRSEDAALASLAGLKTRALASWHFHMLNDADRNRAFAAAIGEAIQDLHKVPEVAAAGGIACLDIGTGTGLLALICAELGQRCGVTIRRIHACDMNDALCAVAREVVALHQGTGGSDSSLLAAQSTPSSTAGTADGGQSSDRAEITLHHSRSDQLQLPEQMDLVFCEAVDAGLLGEGFLPTALDACERLLRSGGVLIPRRAVVFGMLVSCPMLSERFCPAAQEFALEGVAWKPREPFVCEFLELLPHEPLTTPTELLRLDFGNPAQLRQQLAACKLPTVELPPVLKPGTVNTHAHMLWLFGGSCSLTRQESIECLRRLVVRATTGLRFCGPLVQTKEVLRPMGPMGPGVGAVCPPRTSYLSSRSSLRRGWSTTYARRAATR
ncbi:unnamed protein product, partial [Polarella glacialis]